MQKNKSPLLSGDIFCKTPKLNIKKDDYSSSYKTQ